jgi:VWFA-related protein
VESTYNQVSNQLLGLPVHDVRRPSEFDVMRFVSTRSGALAVAVASAIVLPLGAQQAQKEQKPAQPTFRVQVAYVEVDAVVHDRAGTFVPDLKKDDFEVLEDGKRQTIDRVDLVDVPVEPRPTVALVKGRTFEPDVYSNALTPGRLYLIVIDDLQINAARTLGARRIARAFIEQNLAPNDFAAVVVTSGNRKTTQEFTSNRRLLIEAVDKVVGRKVISPGLASLTPMAGPDEGSADAAEPQRIFNARSSLDTLASLASFAGSIRNRRKTMVLISEGPDYNLAATEVRPYAAPPEGADPNTSVALPPFATPGIRRELRDRLRDFIDAANRANVTLYAFDPVVYTQGGDDMMEIPSGLPGLYDAGTGLNIVKTTRVMDDINAAQDNLRTLANETGGFAVTVGRNFAGAFDRIRADNSHYYILGYYPTNEKRDGKFRKIEVRSKRPGLTVTARKGYVAPKSEKAAAQGVHVWEGTSAPLREALLSVLPTSGLPITVSAVPFRGLPEAASVLLMLQTPPGAVKFVERNGRYEGTLEVSFVAVDDTGKVRTGEHLEVAMPLKSETYAAVNSIGLLVQSRVSLPAGRYVLRVGARDVSAERVGAVHCDLEVPDYSKLPLSMSGLVIASAESAAANPRPDQELSKVFADSTPSLIRDFAQRDEISALAEIYDTKAAKPHDVDIVSTVLTEDGREVFRREEKHSTSEIPGTTGGFGYLVKVPLASFAPGSYLLRIEALSQLDVNNPVAREAAFNVVR